MRKRHYFWWASQTNFGPSSFVSALEAVFCQKTSKLATVGQRAFCLESRQNDWHIAVVSQADIIGNQFTLLREE